MLVAPLVLHPPLLVLVPGAGISVLERFVVCASAASPVSAASLTAMAAMVVMALVSLRRAALADHSGHNGLEKPCAESYSFSAVSSPLAGHPLDQTGGH